MSAVAGMTGWLRRLSRPARDGQAAAPPEPGAGSPEAAPESAYVAAGPAEGGGLSREAVVWALRLLIGREPHSEEEIALHRRHVSLADLRLAFARTPEFRAWYEGINAPKPRYQAPAFLLAPPADPRIPWMPGTPSLARPVSQLCTAAQFEEPLFRELADALGTAMGHHRKLWEHVYILAVLNAYGVVGPGRRGLGFGVGRERIPALLAACGTEVLATDAPEEETFNQGWASTKQHAGKARDLFYPKLVDAEAFGRLVSFRPVDMNAIPADLAGRFDCCWSSCSLEHLGSLRHGLDFIENSLSVLRPGGIAVHTTEFNLTSDETTVESPALSIYRRRDIESLVLRLVERGHEVMPFTFHPGDAELDAVIDVPPYGLPHLKLAVGQLTLTSVGIVVRRGPA